jgi:hypothetical protein
MTREKEGRKEGRRTSYLRHGRFRVGQGVSKPIRKRIKKPSHLRFSQLFWEFHIELNQERPTLGREVPYRHAFIRDLDTD